MKITAKGEYACRAVYVLAENSLNRPGTVVPLERIAASQHIPRKYLVQILLLLKKSGVLGSKRGVQGGYYLLRSPRDISVGEVLELVDGPFALRSRRPPTTGKNDPLEAVLEPLLESIRKDMREKLYAIDFQEICSRAGSKEKPMYYI
jgi:Rrf2 family protein